MLEKEIISLGFERVNVPTEDTGDEPFYYYRYQTRDVTLVSTSNLEQRLIVSYWRWAVVALGYEKDSRFVVKEELQDFIQWINDQEHPRQQKIDTQEEEFIKRLFSMMYKFGNRLLPIKQNK